MSIYHSETTGDCPCPNQVEEAFPLTKKVDKPFDLVAKKTTARQTIPQALVPRERSYGFWLSRFIVLTMLVFTIVLVAIYDQDTGPRRNAARAGSTSQPVQPNEAVNSYLYSTGRGQPVQFTPSQTYSITLPMPMSLPKNGKVTKFIKRSGVAPLTIKTAAGANYLVRLKTMEGTNILQVFVRGGKTVNIRVPLGTYEISYASGQDWYGDKDLFGPNTSYTKAQDIFRFSRSGNQISGYTITLYQVVDGNLQTQPINKEQF